MKRLISEYQRLGFAHGPAISDIRGMVLTISTVNECLHKLLFDFLDERKGSFSGNITAKDVIRER